MKHLSIHLWLWAILLSNPAWAWDGKLQTLVGNWSLSGCTGRAPHQEDRLVIGNIRGGIDFTQVSDASPWKSKSYRFYTRKYWEKKFRTQKQTGLKGNVITKIIDNKPTLTRIWSPRKRRSSKEFLSSSVSQYEALGPDRIRVVSTLSEVNNGKPVTVKSECEYFRQKKLTQI